MADDATRVFHDTARAVRTSPEKMQKVNLFESPRMFCDVYALLPGQAQKAHAHAGSDKIYHVLAGTATVRIGEVTHALGPGELAVAPAGVEHGVSNEGELPTSLLVVMAPHPSFGPPSPPEKA